MSAYAAREERSPSLPLTKIGILAAVADCGESVGAYSIVKALATLFPETTIYNSIPQMVELGLLGSELVEGPRGPKPVYFSTEKGRDALKRWATTPPATPLAPSPAMLLWLSAIRARRPRDVLEGIELLAEALEEQELELKLQGKRTRRTEGWNPHADLEYELELAALEASRQFLALAKGRFEELVAALPTDPTDKRRN
jgi:DNA-binding PadR family transcriptional regulator